MDKHPARELLLKVTRDFPDIWKKINVLLEEKENIGWPDWCFLPIDAWIALADYAKGEPNAYHADGFDTGREIALIKLANTFAALGTWRMTQGIYRFDSTLYAELISTPITGEIPVEVLFNLPEWCVYVETPDLKYNELALQGFWAFLEFDHKQKRKELRFLLLTNDSQTIPSILHLDEKDLERAIAAVHKGSAKKVEGLGINRGIYEEMMAQTTQVTTHFLSRALSLLLYICSQNDFAHNQRPDVKPTMPKSKKTKKGVRYFPASKPTTWDVGVRMGAALRNARVSEGESSQSIGESTRRAHIRRAHWHTFLVGPRKRKDGTIIDAQKRDRVLRWIPPIAVNTKDKEDLESLPSVIRMVNKHP